MGPVLAPDLEQVGEAAGCDQSGAGAAFLQQRVGSDRHPVGERLDRGGPGTGPLEDGADRAHHPRRLVSRGGRHLRGVDGAVVEQDRVGEGPADVDPEQHRLSCQLLLAADLAGGGEDEMDPVQLGIGFGTVAAQVTAARLVAPQGAGRGRRGQRVRVGDQRARGRPGCGSARRGARPPRGSPRSAGRSRTRAERGRRRSAPSPSAASAARAPKTKHSLSELEASRLAPCRPVHEHSPTA